MLPDINHISSTNCYRCNNMGTIIFNKTGKNEKEVEMRKHISNGYCIENVVHVREVKECTALHKDGVVSNLPLYLANKGGSHE